VNVHAAVVLAAGGSRRLGHPKQLLTQGGEPLLRRCARLALATGPKRLVVVLGANADRMRETVRDLPLEIALNPDWAEGMAGSLQAAAARIAASSGCWYSAATSRH